MIDSEYTATGGTQMYRKLSFLNWLTILVFLAALVCFSISGLRWRHESSLRQVGFSRSESYAWRYTVSFPIVGFYKQMVCSNNVESVGWAFFYLNKEGVVEHVFVSEIPDEWGETGIVAPITFWVTGEYGLGGHLPDAFPGPSLSTEPCLVLAVDHNFRITGVHVLDNTDQIRLFDIQKGGVCKFRLTKAEAKQVNDEILAYKDALFASYEQASNQTVQ